MLALRAPPAPTPRGRVPRSSPRPSRPPCRRADAGLRSTIRARRQGLALDVHGIRAEAAMSRSLRIEDVMRREFVSLRIGDRLDLAEDIMSLGRVRHMPVMEEGRLVGIVSQRDLLAHSLSKALDFAPQDRRTFLKSVDVSEAMTRNVITIEASASLEEAARLMIRHRVGCLPVLAKGGEPIGIVTETDLIRAAYLSNGGEA
jgi:CBS domain-containing protein